MKRPVERWWALVRLLAVTTLVACLHMGWVVVHRLLGTSSEFRLRGYGKDRR